MPSRSGSRGRARRRRVLGGRRIEGGPAVGSGDDHPPVGAQVDREGAGEGRLVVDHGTLYAGGVLMASPGGIEGPSSGHRRGVLRGERPGHGLGQPARPRARGRARRDWCRPGAGRARTSARGAAARRRARGRRRAPRPPGTTCTRTRTGPPSETRTAFATRLATTRSRSPGSVRTSGAFVQLQRHGVGRVPVTAWGDLLQAEVAQRGWSSPDWMRESRAGCR